MKYVMLTHKKTGLRAPIFCSEQFAHSDVVPKDPNWVPTSAGYFPTEGHKQCVGRSASLQLKPAEGDYEICCVVLTNMESMLMMIQDLEANKEKLGGLFPRK